MLINESLQLYINKWVVDRVAYFNDLLYFQIHITNRCSNSCKHCYFREIPKLNDINLDDCISFILKCKKLAYDKKKRLRIDFIGGDPLLYPYTSELSVLCVENSIEYGLKCNPNEILQNWEEVKAVVLSSADIMLSIDGVKETNDFLRSPGSFQQSLKAIELLKKNNKTVRIHFTASKDNRTEILPLLSLLLQENFIIDDFTWGRYWSEIDTASVLNETDLVDLFVEQIQYLNVLFSSKDFFYFNTDGRLIPRIFFSFKEHLWIPFFIENEILYEDVKNHILSQQDCLNCTATKDVYIVDQRLRIFNCRKKMTAYSQADIFFTREQRKMVFTNFICNDCVYNNVCKSCYAIPKGSCLYYKRR